MGRHHRRLQRRRWAAARRRRLDIDGWRCTACGRPGRLEVHHREPLRDGGPRYDPANLEVLCRPCHLERHGADPARLAWRRYCESLE